MKHLLTQLRNECNNALSAQITYNHILNVVDSFKNFHDFVNYTFTLNKAVSNGPKLTVNEAPVTPDPKVVTTPVFTQQVYGEFAKEMRTRLMKENPTWTATQVIGEIGRQWVLHTGQSQSSNVLLTTNQHAPLPTPNNKPVVQQEKPVTPKPVVTKPVTPKPVTPKPIVQQDKPVVSNPTTVNTLKPPASNAMRYPIFAKDMLRWIEKTNPDWSAEKMHTEIVQLWYNHKKVMGIVPTNKEDLEIEARLANSL
jgi:hypothetical protein